MMLPADETRVNESGQNSISSDNSRAGVEHVKTARSRIDSIDLLRGIVMVVMMLGGGGFF